MVWQSKSVVHPILLQKSLKFVLNEMGTIITNHNSRDAEAGENGILEELTHHSSMISVGVMSSDNVRLIYV